MMVLLANGQKMLECNVCHGHIPIDDDSSVEVSADIHVCSGCRPYQSQSVSFFTWFVLLERLYKEHGQPCVPRGGDYDDDWPIRRYEQGLTPEKAIELMEAKVTQTAT
jgi:hypothetical protein